MKIKQRAQLYADEGFISLGGLRTFMESIEHYPDDVLVMMGESPGYEEQPVQLVDLIVVEREGEA